jgi:beta-glucanase (GH16 family)
LYFQVTSEAVLLHFTLEIQLQARMKTLLLLSLSPLLFAQTENGNWTLTFDDEFNGAELDLSHWVPHDPGGRMRDRQLQTYAPDAVAVNGGQLHIVAQVAQVAKVARRKDSEYVSGIISTFGTFSQTYGRFEIRCRVPAGRGLRPGFLLLPVPFGPLPEIDVFETTGSDPSKVYFANRWGTEQTERSFGDSFTGPDLSAGFHTLSIEWARDKITWFIDGKEKFQSVDGIPRQPMYLLIDLAVGGRLARSPDASTTFPASFDIDYIRVYQHATVK